MKKKYYKDINETIYTLTLKNKMKVYLLYKPGFVNKEAYVVTRFGHFDSIRDIKIDGKKSKIPLGIAHFLEHRMFSKNDLDVSDLFSNNGATSNAYTAYDRTTYYFSCCNKFYENLKVLLDMVNSFESTDKQIENEKSIILQEAHMCLEDPIRLILRTLYKNAYSNHPIKYDIIGTDESIKQTSLQQLQAVFDSFYDPSNLSLVICGDIDHLQLEEFLKNNLIDVKNPVKIEKLKISEPLTVVKEKEDLTLSTTYNTHVGILFKLKHYEDIKKSYKMFNCYGFILDYLFDSSGILNESWLKKKIITSPLYYSTTCDIDLDNIIFYNVNDNIELLLSNIKSVFDKSNMLLMKQEDLVNAISSEKGLRIRNFDGVDSLCSTFVNEIYSLDDKNYYDLLHEVDNITLQDIKEAYENICDATYTYVTIRGDR